MSRKPVVIYGASGYTGRLVAEAMRHHRIPFIAAGRNGARIEEAMQVVPGIDTLEAICSPTGTPTFGSTQTIFSMFQTADTAFYLENNERCIWPAAKGYETMVPDRPQALFSHPWSGGTLPLYFENDPRVVNCRQTTAFTNRELMEQVTAMQQMYENDIKPLPEEEQKQKLAAIGESMQPGMPPRENRLVHRNVDVVHGRGSTHSASCIIRSVNPYQLTGILHAATANYLMGGRQLTAGFTSACQAVGYRELLGALQNFGLCQVKRN